MYKKDQVGNVISSASDEIGYTKILMEESIEDSIVQNVKDVRKASPFTDDRIEGETEHVMGR